jgi:hypothetical protein
MEILFLFQGQKEKLKLYIYFFLSFIFLFFYYIINLLTIYNFLHTRGLVPLDNDIIPYFFEEEVYRKEEALNIYSIDRICYFIYFCFNF